jgi:hypothetical protein
VRSRTLASAATLLAFAAACAAEAAAGREGALYVAPRASAYADGAPAGFSGGFGEPSCHGCHFHAEPDSGPGRVTIAGLPDRFKPGERYPLTITLSRPDMKLGGFQLTARFKDGGAQAGSLATEAGGQERVRIDERSGVQYVSQRRSGTSLAAANTAIWKLLWTAPPTGGPVVVHVAANAANGDDTADGDYVHTAAAESVPGPVRSRSLEASPVRRP